MSRLYLLRNIRRWVRRQYLSGKYDIDSALSQSAEGRDFFLVMICLDLTLYHLYCAFAPKQIPKHREDRYEDALEWLKKAGSGELPAQLLLRESPQNNMITVSSHDKQNHRF